MEEPSEVPSNEGRDRREEAEHEECEQISPREKAVISIKMTDSRSWAGIDGHHLIFNGITFNTYIRDVPI